MAKQAWWRNGSAPDSRSGGCVFESRPGHCGFFDWKQYILWCVCRQQMFLDNGDAESLWGVIMARFHVCASPMGAAAADGQSEQAAHVGHITSHAWRPAQQQYSCRSCIQLPVLQAERGACSRGNVAAGPAAEPPTAKKRARSCQMRWFLVPWDRAPCVSVTHNKTSAQVYLWHRCSRAVGTDPTG